MTDFDYMLEGMTRDLVVMLMVRLKLSIQKLTRSFPIPVPASTSKLQAMYTIS